MYDFLIDGNNVGAHLTLDTICTCLIKDSKKRKTIRIALRYTDNEPFVWHDVYDYATYSSNPFWISTTFKHLNVSGRVTKQKAQELCDELVELWRKVPGVTIDTYPSNRGDDIPHMFRIDTARETSGSVTQDYVNTMFGNKTNSRTTTHISMFELPNVDLGTYRRVVVLGSGRHAIEALLYVGKRSTLNLDIHCIAGVNGLALQRVDDKGNDIHPQSTFSVHPCAQTRSMYDTISTGEVVSFFLRFYNFINGFG